MLVVDYLIVGAGLTGATLARALTDHGLRVQLVERRAILGGNCADMVHSSGIRYHVHGPHFFRTSSERVWNFVQRFAEFVRFEPRILTMVQGRFEPWPLTKEYLDCTFGEDWLPHHQDLATNFEEAVLRQMPLTAYEQFVRDYTRKQWGQDPKNLAASLATRILVREGSDTRLSVKTWQGIPRDGYSSLVQAMLAGIPVQAAVRLQEIQQSYRVRYKTIYTGAIDEYFEYRLGRLAYRSQRREHTFVPDAGCILPAVVVNNPALDAGPHVRAIEWKRIPHGGGQERLIGSLITTETPTDSATPDTHEYPVADTPNTQLYRAYAELAKQEPQMLFCGRLGEYRYLDMDQAIARALRLAERELRTRLGSYQPYLLHNAGENQQ